MRRLSIALALSMILAPATSLAAAASPSELFSSLQDENAAQSFSVTANAHSDDVYISVWTSGAAQGSLPGDMQMNAKATIDVVQDGFKIRVKAEVMIVNGMLYVKVGSLEGSYDGAFASMSAFVKQKLWIKMPVEEAMISEMTEGTPLFVGYGYDASKTDDMFRMQSAPGGNGTTVYSLSLSPDYAVDLAILVRDILSDDSPVSDDFFPWRQLAEGLRYEGTVVTNSSGGFQSSSFTFSTGSSSAYLNVVGKASRAADLRLSAPEGALTPEDVTLMMSGLEVMDEEVSSGEDAMMQGENSFTDATFDDVEDDMESSVPEADCTDPSIEPLVLLSLQRDGTCRVEKVSTRYTR